MDATNIQSNKMKLSEHSFRLLGIRKILLGGNRYNCICHLLILTVLRAPLVSYPRVIKDCLQCNQAFLSSPLSGQLLDKARTITSKKFCGCISGMDFLLALKGFQVVYSVFDKGPCLEAFVVKAPVLL